MAKASNYFKVLPVLMLLLLLTGCNPNSIVFDMLGMSENITPSIPNVPRTYVAEYGRVWSSALDTLDEYGYVIAQMDKADGYITTERKEGERYRDKVSLRIVRVGKEVTVRVNTYSESRRIRSVDSSGTRSYYSWGEKYSSGYFEKNIKDKIAEKLGLAK